MRSLRVQYRNRRGLSTVPSWVTEAEVEWWVTVEARARRLITS